jgi:hypothetical protein
VPTGPTATRGMTTSTTFICIARCCCCGRKGGGGRHYGVTKTQAANKQSITSTLFVVSFTSPSFLLPLNRLPSILSSLPCLLISSPYVLISNPCRVCTCLVAQSFVSFNVGVSVHTARHQCASFQPSIYSNAPQPGLRDKS